ncbi:YetF domain-containing protein [Sutcliffiella horikoshii]|uniref:YetF domain-containing protein n=1 Tax=Sutcliffiella horikoshii TaxID=79883 RepID=UPI002F2661AB
MKKERILEKEVLQAARSSGIKSMNEVEAVVLETDGRISVIKSLKKMRIQHG